MLWSAIDPHRIRLQLFYTSDAAGRFSSPIQATDSGTVLDAFAPTLKLDPEGLAHIGFIANINNNLRLCYATNRLDDRDFSTRVLADVAEYGMAVDSLGNAHFVWTEINAGIASFNYWNSGSGGAARIIATLPCQESDGTPWSIGAPVIEMGATGPVIAVRNDSGAIYMMRRMPNGEFSAMERLVTPPCGTPISSSHGADLRLRLAVDSDGTLHMVVPGGDDQGAPRLYYLSDALGMIECRPLGEKLDAPVTDFDIVVRGNRRLLVVWNDASSGSGSVNIGLAELAPAGPGIWETTKLLPDLAAVAARGDRPSLAGGDVAIAVTDERLVVAGLENVMSDSARHQVVMFDRIDLEPRVRYLLPDAAAPGMNVVLEAYAGPRARGSFGADGLHAGDVRLEMVDPADAERVVIGPAVVSWDGRLVSTMIFVKSGAATGAVPLRLRVGDRLSNIDTFFIVEPQHIGGAAGRLASGGVLGSGGIYGTRTRRGVLVVDSLILDGGTFTIDTVDRDPLSPGNQGFLPATILSRGPVRIGAGATLSVAPQNDLARGLYGSAGPGGGGGGTGGQRGAGSGYTGGGGIARRDISWLMGASSGTGGSRSGVWAGGGSLNGTPGGAAFTNAPGGGGTGHPFGASGEFAKISRYYPLDPNHGGYGGGTGGATSSEITEHTAGGGGGGHATGGTSGGVLEDNHGFAVGSAQLVPLAGGSGGGGGGYSVGGYASGGGGGGALALFSFDMMSIDGTIDADGARGADAPSNGNGSGGGGGAGGGVLMGARGIIAFGTNGHVQANGGAGGKGYTDRGSAGRDGGSGGAGRIRVDGRIVGDALARYSPAPGYIGPGAGLQSSGPLHAGSVVTGSGLPGSGIRVFMLSDAASPSYDRYVDVTVATDSTWSVELGPEVDAGALYLVVMQHVAKPSVREFAYEPEWVMSTAGGSSLGRAAITFDATGISFPCIRFGSCDSLDLTVSNTSRTGDLIIGKLALTGDGASAFHVGSGGIRVAAGESRTLRVFFCPTDTGSFQADLAIGTNIYPDSVRVVRLSGCATTGLLAVAEREIDLGDICIGECRDTVVHMRNEGRADLTISGIAAEAADLTIVPIAPVFPVTIRPGDAFDLHLRLCPKRLDDAGTQFRLISNTVDQLLTITVKGKNVGPYPGIPDSIDFGTAQSDEGEPCMERTLVIRNLNGAHPLNVAEFLLSSGAFTLLDPAPTGTIIPAGGSIELRLQFCPQSTGTYSGAVRLTFNGGSCSVDTVIVLRGEGVSHKARIVLMRPSNRRLSLTSVPLGETTPEGEIMLVNLGSAEAMIAVPEIASLSGTITIRPEELAYRSIAPNGSLLIHATMTPTTTGINEGTIRLASDDGTWSETVTVMANGLVRGITIDTAHLDFGDVRADGESFSLRDLLIRNSGTAPLRIERVEQLSGDDVFLSSLSAPVVIPAAVGAGNGREPFHLTFQFSPTSEGPHTATFRIVNSSGVQPVITLTGNGIMEHLAVNLRSIDFACLLPSETKDTTIIYTNVGTHAMELGDMTVVSTDGSFSVRNEQKKTLLQPGESRTDVIRFTAGNAPGKATLVVEGSAPETHTVALAGEICPLEERTLTIEIPATTARVGSYIMIPILARLPRAVTALTSYSIKLNYAYDLLAPLVATRDDARAPVIDSTLSTYAMMLETGLGELTIGGTLNPGRETDTLVWVPFKVLLGSTYRTDITFGEVFLSTPSLQFNMIPGRFEALDCDTTGTIIVRGSYALDQNLPNPFSRVTIIPYTIAHAEHVVLTLYNEKGNVVRTLVDEVQSPGSHEYRLFDPSLSSGIYTYEIIAGPYRKARRMVMVD